MKSSKSLLDFIKKSPSSFHMVTNSCNILKSEGFTELTLNEDAPIQITKILDVNRKLIIEKNILYKA